MWRSSKMVGDSCFFSRTKLHLHRSPVIILIARWCASLSCSCTLLLFASVEAGYFRFLSSVFWSDKRATEEKAPVRFINGEIWTNEQDFCILSSSQTALLLQTRLRLYSPLLYSCVCLLGAFCSFRKFFMHINFLLVPKFTYLSSDSHSSSSFASVYFWQKRKATRRRERKRRGRGKGDVQSIFPYRWAHLQHKGMTKDEGLWRESHERKTNLFYIFYFFTFVFFVFFSHAVSVPSGWLVRHTGIPIQRDGRTLRFLKARSLLSIFCCQFKRGKEEEEKRYEREHGITTTKREREREKLIKLFPQFIVEWWLIGTTTE